MYKDCIFCNIVSIVYQISTVDAVSSWVATATAHRPLAADRSDGPLKQRRTNADGTSTIDGHVFPIYASGRATLLVDQGPMTVQALSTIAAWIPRTAVLAGAALLIVGLSSIGLPPAWRLPSAALADPGGNGNGKGNGGSKGNGGHSGEHQDNGKGPNNGKGPGANSQSGGDDGEDGEDGDVAAPQAKAAAETERDGRDYVPDELVVANLAEDARSDVGRLGFVVLDEQQLASLDLKITRLRVPHQMTAPTARTLLASRYPGILVDLNAVYRPQGQLSLGRPPTIPPS